MTRNDEDGWTDLTWNHPLMFDRNFAVAGFDRPHVLQMGFVWGLPFLRDSTSIAGKILQGWQVNGLLAAYSGAPFSVAGTNTALDCQGCGNGDFITIDVSGNPKPTGAVGSSTEPYLPACYLLAANGCRGRRLWQQRPQPLPTSGYLERQSVTVQVVPDWTMATGVSAGSSQRVQPHELGPPGRGVYCQQLHAVRATEYGAHRRQQRVEHARTPADSNRPAHSVLIMLGRGLPGEPF